MQPRSQPRGSPITTMKKKRMATTNIKIMTRRIANSYKHKRKRMKTTKIKITMTRRVVNIYNEKRKEGK